MTNSDYYVQITDDAELLALWLRAEGYPAIWNPESIRRFVVRLRVYHGQEHVGYVWANWTTIYADALDFHVCIKKGHRARWLTPSVHSDLETLGRLCGAKHLITKPVGERAQRLIPRLLKPYGFSQFDNGWIHKQINGYVLWPEDAGLRTDSRTGAEEDGKLDGP